MACGDEYSFQGTVASAMNAVMMPPRLNVMYFGQTLARSYAGDTKFATMLTPTVARTNTSAPISTIQSFSTLFSSSVGSSTAEPYTLTDAADTTTEVSANSVQLTGRPQKLPRITARLLGANRAKSEKFSISVASTPMVSPTAAKVWYTCSPVLSGLPPVVQEMSKSACQSIQPAMASMAAQTAGPAQPWRWRTASMPRTMTASCNPHRIRKASQPSRLRPTKLVFSSPFSPGMKRTSRICSATAARYVWTPYQPMATIPRTRAGKLAPHTPQLIRLTTGWGGPVIWLIKPDLEEPAQMTRQPPRMPRVTCQGLRPSRNRPAAKV